MRRRKLQRGLAIVLSAAMLVTGISVPGTTAKAATSSNVVFSDDMEGKTTEDVGWKVTWKDSAASGTEGREANQWASNNKTTWWHFDTTEAQTLTLTYVIKGAKPGNYSLSIEADGDDDKKNLHPTGQITLAEVSDEVTASDASNRQTKDMTFGAWDVFAATTTDTLTIDKTSDLAIVISVTTQANGWFDLDNIQLVQELSDDETKAAAVSSLETLLTECKGLTEGDYQAESWSALQKAITDAQAVYDNAESKTLDEINSAITALQTAKGALVPATIVENAGINVEKVEGITDDFVRGVDISTYKSLIDSGVTFKDWEGKELDEVGFFTLLKNAGVNYVRIRVWNDPYYTDGNKVKYGYGAGNCDVEKAAQMGKWATDAGLKVMIDFHYSDFWADPGRQIAPKAWTNYTVDQKAAAISTFTEESLNTIIAAGADVGMVQVGNETTAGICGVKNTSWTDMCKLFSAGCNAVHKVASDKKMEILAAIHFTNPENTSTMKGYADTLNTNKVDYDVFATSYYPYWHGTLSNLTSVLSYVAKTYNKKVMVAETSWARTMEDGDGQPNVVRSGKNDDTSQYAATVQGQANEVRAVIQAVADVGNAGIGVMYWEPAWLPVNVYDATAENAEEVLAANKLAWETYGSGWASSYSIDYDTGVNEENYGGSEWDNQAMFDFYGNPLPSLNVFKYVLTGATTPKKMDMITDTSVSVGFGEDIASVLPATVNGVYNDGTTEEGLSVVWNQADIDAITTFGLFKVKGTVTYETEEGGTDTITAVCTVNVSPKNLLPQGDFESGRDKWTIEGTGINSKETENPRTGKYCLAFYLGNAAYELTATQTVTAEMPGTYSAFMYLQGGESDAATAKIKLSNDTQGTSAEADASVKGWLVWQNPVVDDVKAAIGDKLTITITVTGEAASWGSIDDVCLYLKEADPVYNITYHLNDGVNAESNPAIYDGNKDVTFTDPTREGYTFEGWYADSEFTSQITGIAAGTKENIELYAKWKQNEPDNPNNPVETVKVTGIKLSATAQKLQKGKSVTLKATVTPANATDASVTWSSSNTKVATVTNGVVKAVAGGTAVITATANDGSGVKAVCNITVPYTITYKLNGGTNNKANPSSYYNQKVTLKNPTRKGYTFSGWYTDSKFKKKVTGIAKTSKKDITLYAKWTKVTVKKVSIKNVTNSAKQKAKVTINKVAGAKGYQIVYSTDKKFKKSVKKVTTTKTTYTLSKLKKGKTYYVKVCAYKLDSKGNKVYGAYSKVKTVKIKK